jgi:hypothetical protein
VAFLWHEIAVEGFLWLVAVLTVLCALHALAVPRSAASARPSVATVLAGGFDPRRRDDWLTLLQLIAVVGATVVSLGLAFDARYRDFPSLAFAMPALAHLLLCATGRDRGTPAGDRREEALLSLILLAASLTVPVIEGPQNLRALIWVGTALFIALPWLRYLPGFLRGGAGKPVLAVAR